MSANKSLDDMIVKIKKDNEVLEKEIQQHKEDYEKLSKEKLELEERILDISGNIVSLNEKKVVLDNTIKEIRDAFEDKTITESEDAYNKILKSTQLLMDTISSKLN